MKKMYSLLSILFWGASVFAQNVGIGTNAPSTRLEVKKPLKSTVKISTTDYFADTTQLIFSNRDAVNSGTDMLISSNKEEGLRFSSSSDLSSQTKDTIMQITPQGNVGIGIATPNEKLEVKGNIVTNGLKIQNNAANTLGNFTKIEFGGSNYTTGNISTIGTATNTARMGFSTGYSNIPGIVFLQERLSIANNGNVGVGQTNPQAKLDVAGDINTTGIIKLNGVEGSSGQVLTSNGVASPTWQNTAFSNTTRFCSKIAANTLSPALALLHTELYNTNPSQVTVASDRINILQSGLYRLNGYVTSTATFNGGSAINVFAQNELFVGGIQYDFSSPYLFQIGVIGGVYNTRSTLPFNFDIYIQAPAYISLTGKMNFSLPVSVSSYSTNTSGLISGYLISQ
jgi:hypothetical protein